DCMGDGAPNPNVEDGPRIRVVGPVLELQPLGVLGSIHHRAAPACIPVTLQDLSLLDADGLVGHDVRLAGEQARQGRIRIRLEDHPDPIDLRPAPDVAIERNTIEKSPRLPMIHAVGARGYIVDRPVWAQEEALTLA